MHNRNPRREGGANAAGHHGLYATDERLVQVASARQRTVRRQQRQHIVPAAVDQMPVIGAHNPLGVLGELGNLLGEVAVIVHACQSIDRRAHPVPVGDQDCVVRGCLERNACFRERALQKRSVAADLGFLFGGDLVPFLSLFVQPPLELLLVVEVA
jgi:hypothetical protein